MKVLLWGPISPQGQPSKGGFEATNRKIADKLEEEGIYVRETPNPVVNHKWGALGNIVYIKLFLSPLKLLKYIGKKDYVLHVTPNAGPLIYPFSMIVYFAHLFKIPVLYHMMAGTFFITYNRNTRFYRFAAINLIKNSSAIAVEGSVQILKLRDIIGYKGIIHYLPTTTYCREFSKHHIEKDVYNLFYFGRLNKAKGVNMMFDIIELLDDRFHLYLDGFISDDIDKARLNTSKTTYLGIESKSQLKETMKNMTFFILPTTHEGEGQPNSLVEAMAEGLIPITSNQGFCSEVVGDCGMVLSMKSTAEEYRDAILDLCDKDLESLSIKCQERIIKNHNADVEILKLIDLYKNILTSRQI